MLQSRCSRANWMRACRWRVVNFGPLVGRLGVRLASFNHLRTVHSLTATLRTLLSSCWTSTPVKWRFRSEVEIIKRSSLSEVDRWRLILGLRLKALVSWYYLYPLDTADWLKLRWAATLRWLSPCSSRATTWAAFSGVVSKIFGNKMKRFCGDVYDQLSISHG